MGVGRAWILLILGVVWFQALAQTISSSWSSWTDPSTSCDCVENKLSSSTYEVFPGKTGTAKLGMSYANNPMERCFPPLSGSRTPNLLGYAAPPFHFQSDCTPPPIASDASCPFPDPEQEKQKIKMSATSTKLVAVLGFLGSYFENPNEVVSRSLGGHFSESNLVWQAQHTWGCNIAGSLCFLYNLTRKKNNIYIYIYVCIYIYTQK